MVARCWWEGGRSKQSREFLRQWNALREATVMDALIVYRMHHTTVSPSANLRLPGELTYPCRSIRNSKQTSLTGDYHHGKGSGYVRQDLKISVFTAPFSCDSRSAPQSPFLSQNVGGKRKIDCSIGSWCQRGPEDEVLGNPMFSDGSFGKTNTFSLSLF